MDALAELGQKPGWWQDVLRDSSLIIGIRDERFDVYWNGQSLFNASFDGDRVNVKTHIKYLLDPDRSDHVDLKGDIFEPKSTPILARYTPGTMSKLKRAANLFSGMEKQGVHAIARANENIVDVEIRVDAKDIDTERDQPRIDIAAFEHRSDGIELVFWEAKLFANKELRASGTTEPKVVRQIEEYKHVLQKRQDEVLSSYRVVAKNLVGIANMSNDARAVGPAIQAVASRGEALRMSSMPKVGLVIFGFDADQKAEDSIGRKHFKKLEDHLEKNSLCTRGTADGLKLCFQA
jgi:hypothetical protein